MTRLSSSLGLKLFLGLLLLLLDSLLLGSSTATASLFSSSFGFNSSSTGVPAVGCWFSVSNTGGNSGRESVVSGTGTGLGSSGLMYVLLLRASNKVSTKSLVLVCRKTSSWSTQVSFSSFKGLSFFTRATTYFARAPASASHIGAREFVNHSLRCSTFSINILTNQLQVSLQETIWNYYIP